ncbi:hypothetical protein BKA01_007922 [Pseudonocardia eucalypti]|nr:hypothetical protein [Pseudonocardia eucalypti]
MPYTARSWSSLVAVKDWPPEIAAISRKDASSTGTGVR